MVHDEGRVLIIAANNGTGVDKGKVDALKMLKRRVEFSCPR
jgi:hypothetical protein